MGVGKLSGRSTLGRALCETASMALLGAPFLAATPLGFGVSKRPILGGGWSPTP